MSQLPKETLKAIIKKGCVAYLPGQDFKIEIRSDGRYLTNLRIPDGNIVIEYHVEKCLCQRKQKRGSVIGGVLQIDE